MTPWNAQRTLSSLPLILQWNAAHPLPLRTVQQPRRGRRGRQIGLEAPPWHETGSASTAFPFSEKMKRLCNDIVAKTPEFRHIDTNRLLFCMTQARSSRTYGLQARVTPLRFRHGKLNRTRHGVMYQVQRYFVDQREMLYLVTFCLPRFLEQDFDEKMITIFHELYHISPDFDGDLRRHGGRCQFHTKSKQQYDLHMGHLARAYLNTRPDPVLHAFLRLDFAQIVHRHGAVTAFTVPRPRQVPVLENQLSVVEKTELEDHSPVSVSTP